MSYAKLTPKHGEVYRRIRALKKRGNKACDSVDHNAQEGCSNPKCWKHPSDGPKKPRYRKRAPRMPEEVDIRYTVLFMLRLDEDREEVIKSLASIDDVSESEVVREAISLLALLYTATKGEANRAERKRILAAALAQITKDGK